ncbi:DUF4386 domain-containing protein [Marivirga aurantiaca]|nr:DUF4386 domain-containing protein [Marivirga aurantiaca]
MKIRLVGILMLLSMLVGIFSVSPAIDSAAYLTEAAANSNQVILAAVYQFVLALIYVAIALLLYPVITYVDKNLAIGFLSFRIIASTLMVVGTVFLLSILSLSQGHSSTLNHNTATLEIIGNMLKYTRDYFNHVFMVLVLGVSNVILYYLLFKSKLIPNWMSIGGFIATFLSIFASILLLFQVVEVITLEYLILNAPTALIELILGIWLITKGLNYSNISGVNNHAGEF